VIRAGAGEGDEVAAGFEDAKNLAPHANIVRDARAVPGAPHEAKLVRRIAHHAIDRRLRE
jgi:hypothetical protein